MAELDRDRLLTLIVECASRLFAGNGSIFLVRDDGMLVPRAAMEPGAVGELPFGVGVVGRCAETRRGLVVNNYPAWPGALPHRLAVDVRHIIAHPLIVGEHLLGVLAMNRKGESAWPFRDEDAEILSRLADQAASALENARLFDASERQRRIAETLAGLGRLLARRLDVDVVMQEIANGALTMFDALAATVARVEPGSGNRVVAAVAGEPAWHVGETQAAGSGLSGLAMSTRAPVASTNLAADPRIIYPAVVLARVTAAPRAALAVPLVSSDEVIGIVVIGARAGRVFSDEDIRLAEALADQAVIALENARLFDASERQRRIAETLTGLGRLLAQRLDVNVVMQEIAKSALAMFDAVATHVQRIDPGSGNRVVAAVAGESAWHVGETHAADSGLSGLAMSTRAPVTSTDSLDDPRVPYSAAFLSRMTAAPSRAALAVPLVSSDEVVGIVVIGARPGRVFSDEDIRLAEALADQAAVAVVNARLYENAVNAYRQLSAMQEQLVQSQKMEAVGQLTGGVAHDFNNLLTVILGNLERIDEEHPDLQAWVKPAFAAIERGAELTRRLLAFGRRQMLRPRVIDVDHLVDNMGVLLRRTLGADIAFESVHTAGLWRTVADAGQLENSILNLALNARDAMPAGGILTVETANAHFDGAYVAGNPDVTPGQYVMICVTDTGIGMPAHVVRRAFEPFFTTKGVGKGSGLGLSMIYGFARQSGGHVTIDSAVNEGTTVRLYLPRSRAVAEPVPDDERTGLPRSSGRESILVVEDEAPVRDTVVMHLTSLGYRLLVATTAPEALAILESREPIDLLFTDIVLPGGTSGAGLAEAARAVRPRLKVLFTSGYAANAIGHQGRLDEGAALLSKPYRKPELARKIREALDAP